VLLGIILLGCAAFVVLPPIFKTSRPSWPPVDDPNALFQECANLVKTPGRIEEANWPPSVRKLSPRYVRADREHVNITISTGGIGASWGYLVYPDGKPTAVPSGLLIRETVRPRLFKYESDE
jgi:hypothetical protein